MCGVREDEKKKENRKLIDLMLIGTGLCIISYAIGSAGKAKYKAEAQYYKVENDAYKDIIRNTVFF